MNVYESDGNTALATEEVRFQFSELTGSCHCYAAQITGTDPVFQYRRTFLDSYVRNKNICFSIGHNGIYEITVEWHDSDCRDHRIRQWFVFWDSEIGLIVKNKLADWIKYFALGTSAVEEHLEEIMDN